MTSASDTVETPGASKATDLEVENRPSTGEGKDSSPPAKPALQAHRKCLFFPTKTDEEMEELMKNMVERRSCGLPPLEQSILLLDGQILDGRHRYEAWTKLAKEGVCDGWFSSNAPPTEAVSSDDEQVALRLSSLNLQARNLSAEQKAAIWLNIVEDTPSLRAKLELTRKENSERMKSGKKPLVDSAAGSNTRSFLAKGAGVSENTMGRALKIKKGVKPEEFANLTNGTTTLKALEAKIKSKAETKNASSSKADGNETRPEAKPLAAVRSGDVVFTVDEYEFGQGDIYIESRTVDRQSGDTCLFTDGSRLNMTCIYDQGNAALQRQKRLRVALESLRTEVTTLRSAISQPPKIRDKKQGIKRPKVADRSKASPQANKK